MTKAHPENVPGPFYVEEGCCIACGVPEAAAPEIFGWASDGGHCVVKRQPVSADEIDRTLVAICSAEVDCIRYRGKDFALARRIAEAGHAESCDAVPPGAQARLRSRVTFTSRPGDSVAALAARLRASLTGGPWVKVEPARPWNRASVVYSWDHGLGWRPHYHRIAFEAASEPDRFRATLRPAFPDAGVGLALAIHDWLTNAEGIATARWYAPDEDWDRDPGLPMPV